MSGDDHARRSEGLKRALRRPWKLTDAARMSADAFAERYAHSRGLSYEITAGTPRGTWFLGAVWAKRSHSFLRGRLAGGADGLLFYPEKLVGGGRVAVREGWTAACYEIPAARELAQGIACVPRLGPIWGGRVKLVSAIPPGLAVTTTGDTGFDGTYEVGVASDHDRAGVSALFDADFTAWMRGLPFGKLGEQSTRIELCAGVLCVYTKGMLTTAEELDAFCQRAARIAAEVQRAVAGQAGRAPGPAEAGQAGREPGPAGPAQAAELRFTESAAAAVRDAGAADGRLSADSIEASVRRAVAAWVRAAEGDEAALAAVAHPEAAEALLRPAWAGRPARLVARGVRVTYIMVNQLQADAGVPVLGILFDCRGVRYLEDPGTGSVLTGDPGAEAPFVQSLSLRLDGAGTQPWRVYAGDTRTLEPPLDYTFSCRRETPGEYRERTGATAIPPEGARRGPRFQIRADFAEHDERFSGSVTFVVERDAAPTREEAAELAYPAIGEETARRLGEGDWRPSLSGLEVRELLDLASARVRRVAPAVRVGDVVAGPGGAGR